MPKISVIFEKLASILPILRFSASATRFLEAISPRQPTQPKPGQRPMWPQTLLILLHHLLILEDVARQIGIHCLLPTRRSQPKLWDVEFERSLYKLFRRNCSIYANPCKLIVLLHLLCDYHSSHHISCPLLWGKRNSSTFRKVFSEAQLVTKEVLLLCKTYFNQTSSKMILHKTLTYKIFITKRFCNNFPAGYICVYF